MDLSLNLVDACWRASYVLKHEKLLESSCRATPSPQTQWTNSALNPKNRPDTLDTRSSGWRIDGATACGTCFYAVPLDLMPRKIPQHCQVKYWVIRACPYNEKEDLTAL